MVIISWITSLQHIRKMMFALYLDHTTPQYHTLAFTCRFSFISHFDTHNLDRHWCADHVLGSLWVVFDAIAGKVVFDAITGNVVSEEHLHLHRYCSGCRYVYCICIWWHLMLFAFEHFQFLIGLLFHFYNRLADADLREISLVDGEAISLDGSNECDMPRALRAYLYQNIVSVLCLWLWAYLCGAG